MSDEKRSSKVNRRSYPLMAQEERLAVVRQRQIGGWSCSLLASGCSVNSRLESTVRYRGVEIDDALEISEQLRSDQI